MTDDQQIWYALTSIFAGFLGGWMAWMLLAYMLRNEIKKTNSRKPNSSPTGHD